jgi:lysophospholipase L1-like esterase
MATNTPNYALRKPAATDLVNVKTDLSDNWDKVDAHAHSGTYAPFAPAHLLPGRKWAFLGDSITDGTGSSNVVYAFPTLAVLAAGGQVARTDSIEAGTPGYTSALALAYLPTVLSTYSPEGLVVLLGTNDAGTAVTLATFQANITAIVRLAKIQGLPVVLCTVPPRSAAVATAPIRTKIAAYNAWLRFWGPAQGCEVAEVFGATVDTTTGDLLAAYDSGDGIHPANLGHARIAQVVAQAMKRAAGDVAFGLRFAKDAFSLVSNPLMLGSGTATGWGEFAGGTGTAPAYSIESDLTGALAAGRWQVIDFDATASGGTRRFLTGPSFTGVTVGDVVVFHGVILVEDYNGTWEVDAAAGTSAVAPQVLNLAVTDLHVLGERNIGVNVGDLFATGNTCWQLGPYYMAFVVPAATTGFYLWVSVQLPTGKHVKVRVGAMDLFNATTLGITAFATGAGMTFVSGP